MDSKITKISLSIFTEFVGAPDPAQRLASVDKAKTRYRFLCDYWGLLRIGIQRKCSGLERDVLDLFWRKPDSKKIAAYISRAASFRQWETGHMLAWIGLFPPGLWTRNGLSVKVRPDLGLKIDGQDHAVKLYFKDDPPRERFRNAVLSLMKMTLPPLYQWTPALLDVPRGQLITAERQIAGFDSILEDEAAAFIKLLIA